MRKKLLILQAEFPDQSVFNVNICCKWKKIYQVSMKLLLGVLFEVSHVENYSRLAMTDASLTGSIWNKHTKM